MAAPGRRGAVGRSPTDVRGTGAGTRVWCGGPGLGRLGIGAVHGPLLRQHGARAVPGTGPTTLGLGHLLPVVKE